MWVARLSDSLAWARVLGIIPQGDNTIKKSGEFTFMQGGPPHMDGLFFDLMQKREKARVYSQYIHSRFTLDRHLDDLRIRASQIWGWLSVRCAD